MLKMLSKFRGDTRGFTLAETVVAMGIFVIAMGLIAGFALQAFSIDRKVQVSRETYEESRIMLNRIAKEIREGTVDYEEYWNMHRMSPGAADTAYGRNYGEYAAKFFQGAPARSGVSRNSLNTGSNQDGRVPLGDANSGSYGRCQTGTDVPVAPDATGYQQCELYLISADGQRKTIFRVQPRAGIAPVEYELAMLRLDGDDTDGDGTPDAWTPQADFGTAAAPKFVSIHPSSLAIKRLTFVVSPLEDPRKAYATFTDQVQIHPQITVLLSVEPSNRASRGVRGTKPVRIDLQTTISARAQSEVKSL